MHFLPICGTWGNVAPIRYDRKYIFYRQLYILIIIYKLINLIGYTMPKNDVKTISICKLIYSESPTCFPGQLTSLYADVFVHKHCHSLMTTPQSNRVGKSRPAICYKLPESRYLKMPKCPQKSVIKSTNNATKQHEYYKWM